MTRLLTRQSVWIVLLLALAVPAWAQTWPNEPSGSTVLSDWGFDTCNGGGWSGDCVAIVSDATAPISPPAVMRFRYDTSSGFGGGELWTIVNSREFYIGFWHYLSDPFEGVSNGANKVIFSFTDDSIAWYLKWQGEQGSGLYYPSFQWTTSEPQNDTYLDNCHITENFYIADPTYPCLLRQWNSPTPVPLGQWFRFEMHYKASTFTNTQDGFVTYWLNGNNILDIQQLNTPNANVSQLFFTPTWTPPVHRSNPDEMRWDHVRLSVCSGCATVSDQDGDGIPDSSDQCPTIPGPGPTGCPPPTDTISPMPPDQFEVTRQGGPILPPPAPTGPSSGGDAGFMF